MKLINNTIIKKLLLSLILVVMLGNSIMPNRVQADAGGTLARPIFQFVAWLGDKALELMQYVFIGESKITEDKINYHIKYSPGIIFSGNVLAFDVNFINPNRTTITTTSNNVEKTEVIFDDAFTTETATNTTNNNADSVSFQEVYKVENGKLADGETYTNHVDTILAKYGLSRDSEKKLSNSLYSTQYEYSNGEYVYTISYGSSGLNETVKKKISKENAESTKNTIQEEYEKEFNKIGFTDADKVGNGINGEIRYEKTVDNVKYVAVTTTSGGYTGSSVKTTTTYKITQTTKENKTITSTAAELQETIATWYNGLRVFALVGLLSVLVYIGIRIIISSAADDKAKYKKMITNWVAAVCIVFILHYIMVFILNISSSINDIFNADVISQSGEDNIMNDLRNKMKDTDEEKDFTQIAGTTIIYVALVIYTGVFSIQYIKRVIYMAFLTMIAPLIALTYPLDKIKDGKAQAFSMWLKEYIFNALLQPIHLLLYYILIGTAESFAISNPIYAVVAVGFLVPAEKFFRKMFGMESQTSVGTIGAAAGGAMVMSMLSKLKGKPPKEEGEKQQKVRTADQNGGSGSSGGASRTGNSGNTGNTGASGTSASDTGTSNVPVADNGTGNNTANTTRVNNFSTSGSEAGNTVTSNTRASNSQTISSAIDNGGSSGEGQVRVPSKTQRFKRGASAVGSKYIYGKDARKKLWKGTRRTIMGAAGGLALGTIGLAAGVASGDAEKAFQYAGAGAAAGYIGAANLGENVWSGGKGIGSTFKEGYMGTEAYNNAQFDKQFFASDEYKMIAEDPQIAANGIDPKEAVQGYLSQGVTDGTQIRKLLQKGIDADTYKGYADNNMKDPDKIRQLRTAQVSAAEYGEYVKNAHIRDIDKICDLKESNIDATTYDAFERMGISNINTIKKYKGDINKAREMRTIARQLKNSDLSQIDEETRVPRVLVSLIRVTREGQKISKEDIQKIWENIQDFL